MDHTKLEAFAVIGISTRTTNEKNQTTSAKNNRATEK